MTTLQVHDNSIILDLTGRIFEVRIDGGSLILNEAIPAEGSRPVNIEMTFDSAMLNVILKRVAANASDKPTDSPKLPPVKGFCTICHGTAEQDAVTGTWEHLEFSCESPKAKFTVTPPEVDNPNDVKVALNDLVTKFKPLRPAMSPTLRSVMDKVEEWSRS